MTDATPAKVRLNEELGHNATRREVFSTFEVEQAIRHFLEYGEQQLGKSQKGYYSGSGWAARCRSVRLWANKG